MSEVAALLTSLQEDFDWSERSNVYEAGQQWQRPRSGTFFYRMTGKPSGPDVLVKTGRAWDGNEAERLYTAMLDLAKTFEATAVDNAAATRPLAWSAAPPALVMPYLVGTDLVSLLRDPDRREWAHMRRWMRSTGMMLAAFHDSHPTPSAGDIAPAGDEVRETAQRVKLPTQLVESLLSEIDWRQRCSLAFGDFGPGNLLGTGDGRLYLLDPPDQPVIALPHKDIGNFIFELRRQLAGHGYTRTPPVRGRFHELRDGFLHGYFEGSARAIDSCDRAMISLFEMRRAVGMARKRFPDRVGDAVWFARSAVARRREVTSADCDYS